MNLLKIKNKNIPCLVAVTKTAQAQGLMNRPWPPPPMVFPYTESDIKSFWMHNTPSPLDIIFCQGNKIIDITVGVPFSKDIVFSKSASDLVVELPHGSVKLLDLKIQDEIEVVYDIATLAEVFSEKLKKFSRLA